ncbi:MAG TPA: DUF1028 domain-containing protein, partial [Gaiellaceae bacterium]
MTYSIVARDEKSGELGVAVQSRAFAAAAVVPWAWPGVGAVATQAYGEKSYGPLGLELLRAGKPPKLALDGLLAADPQFQTRQVAILAADGEVAVHTGKRTIPASGHRIGDGVSAQANCVAGPAVWESMVDAFAEASGTLARRLLAALDAAEAAGGDWRGKQAAGLLVVPAEGPPWERVSDLRVDDHSEPLRELRRLLDLEDGYRALDGDNRAEAARAFHMDALDVRFAEILDAAQAGDMRRGRELLAPLLADEPRWADYMRALADAAEL